MRVNHTRMSRSGVLGVDLQTLGVNSMRRVSELIVSPQSGVERGPAALPVPRAAAGLLAKGPGHTFRGSIALGIRGGAAYEICRAVVVRLSPGCRAVELSRLRRGAVEALSRPCLSSLSSSCRVPVEPVEADSMRLGVE